MPLTPETGSGVAGADTYATVAECRTYAAKRGLVLGTDAAVEISLVNACDYLETLLFKGEKTNVSNALAWPRVGIILEDGSELGSDQIPQALKNAQCQLACEHNAGTELQPTGTGREVTEETVGPITTKYAARGEGTVAPQMNKALGMLSAYLNTGSGFFLSTERA